MKKIIPKVKTVLKIKLHIKRKSGLIVFLALTNVIVAVLRLSKYSFQKACLKREIRRPDLGNDDDWQYKILTEA